MEILAGIENVVRAIFPATMIREGELLPAAFKLRELNDGPERYISVFRQFADTFAKDLADFDKKRNLPCCIMNVNEVNSIKMEAAGHKISFRVMAVPTPSYASHGGIFISLGMFPIEGRGINAFSAANIGEQSEFHMIAIRRRLVELGKKRMTNTFSMLG